MTKKTSQGKLALVSQIASPFAGHEMPKAMTATDGQFRRLESDGFRSLRYEMISGEGCKGRALGINNSIRESVKKAGP